jgi:hypothetical protein
MDTDDVVLAGVILPTPILLYFMYLARAVALSFSRRLTNSLAASSLTP